MSSDESNKHPLSCIVYVNNQPVFIAANIEYNTSTLQDTGICIFSLNISRTSPSCFGCFFEPGLQLLFSITMLFPKLTKYLFSDYSH